MKQKMILLLLFMMGFQFADSATAEDWAWINFKRDMKTGKEVVVEMIRGNSHEGTILAIDDDGLVLKVGYHPMKLRRETIKAVKRPSQIGKASGIGAIIGGATGLVTGLVKTCHNCDSPGSGASILTAACGAAVGSGIGALAGLFTIKTHYKNPLNADDSTS